MKHAIVMPFIKKHCFRAVEPFSTCQSSRSYLNKLLHISLLLT